MKLIVLYMWNGLIFELYTIFRIDTEWIENKFHKNRLSIYWVISEN